MSKRRKQAPGLHPLLAADNTIPRFSPFWVASIVSVLPPVMKNAEGPNSVLSVPPSPSQAVGPAVWQPRLLLAMVSTIVCPSSALSNTTVSPEAALLIASRRVGQLFAVQFVLSMAAGSPTPVTVHVALVTKLASGSGVAMVTPLASTRAVEVRSS